MPRLPSAPMSGTPLTSAHDRPGFTAREAFQAAARELTRVLSAIDPDDPYHRFAVETMGSIAIDLRACGEHLPPSS